MNTSFDAFRIVNTYGAFGSITKVRTEVVLQGTTDTTPGEHTVWRDFEFKCKPGDIDRRPCLISPWHYRLDWLMWFAAFQNYQSCPWIIHLAVKIMNGDTSVNSLLAVDGNPFSKSERTIAESVESRPRIMRALLYEYRYNLEWLGLGMEHSRQEHWETGIWWKRRVLKEYIPAFSPEQDGVKNFLSHYGFNKSK